MKRIEAVMSQEKLQSMLGLKGKLGAGLTRLVMKILEIDKCNSYQARHPEDNAPDFAKHILEDVGVRYVLPEGQLDHIPAEGGFITVSNHHFGSIDGLILCDTVGRKRKDYKLLTTFLLSLIPNLKEGFLPVDNLSGKQDARSVNSIRTALRHIADGGAIGFFPAGEVATYQKPDARTALGEKPVVEDKPWAANIIKLIKKSGLPVIPIYFDGTNSDNFHALGKIHRRLRTARLIHELFNKQGTVVQVRIGTPIPAAEMADMDVDTLGKYLRSRTYALEANCLPDAPAPVVTTREPIAEAEDPQLVREELARIEESILFESGDYRCYLASPADIPHTLRELARLREIVFRAVGEGSGKALDTDIYDTYYKHLIVWNVSKQEIAGAYRIGFGDEVMARPEKENAFYTSTLFQFQKGLLPYLPKAMELGRTIVTPGYQRDVVTLKLLLSGIVTAAFRHGSTMRYAIGPVSTTNDLPLFYKSLVYHFILKHYSLPEANKLIQPTHPLHPDFLRVDPDQLLVNCHSVDDLDRLVCTLSDGRFRLPVLLRKYISFGANILDFNVDPDFNDCVDGFVLLDFKNTPANTFRAFSRFLTEEEQKKQLD